MTDLSATDPVRYAGITALCWAVPAAALAYGLFRVNRLLHSLPCRATDRGYACALRRFHGGHHRALPKRGGFEYGWEDPS